MSDQLSEYLSPSQVDSLFVVLCGVAVITLIFIVIAAINLWRNITRD